MRKRLIRRVLLHIQQAGGNFTTITALHLAP
jgi:hypothetical protein